MSVELSYVFLAWQGRGGYNSAAKTPHEAQMSKVLAAWRQLASQTVLIMLPVCIFVIMNHPQFSSLAASIKASIANISDPQIQKQMTVPIALSHIFPAGIMGLFCAMMFASMVTTDQPYLHAWGSILIQDVILPLRKKPFTPQQHIRVLRISIFLVAVFIFCFSMFFKQTTHIVMFFRVSAGIFLGGAGAVIIFGLYWKWGTTAGAWCAMITGAVLSTASVVIESLKPDLPLTGMDMYGITIGTSFLVYFIVSLLGKRVPFEMDRMLHRGKYAIAGEETEKPAVGFKSLITKDFTKGDKLIYVAVIVWTLGWFAVFAIGTIYSLLIGFTDKWWAGFWKIYIYVSLFLGVVTTIWFMIGGIFDVKDILRLLSTIKRNPLDDGRVPEHKN
jgi:SSS family solute:Na+ symporter